MLKPKSFHLHKALRQYYRAYYNDNFLRNYRFIFDKTQSFVNKEGQTITYDATSLNAKKYEFNNANKKAPNWLIQKGRANYGTLAGEITYYKTLEDFKKGKIKARFCDRLFFDSH